MKVIHTEDAPQAIGTYSQAIEAGGMVYLSGQIPLNPETMTLCSADISEQIHQVFKNISAVVHAASCSLSQVVKLTVYLTDLTYFSRVNEIMAQYFSEPYPARVALGVSALPRGALIEIDAIVMKESIR
jgi:reactive intermediate/imine deaminase